MIKPLPNTNIYMMDHGISLPDYYTGSAGVTLQAIVTNTSTIGEVLDELESEFNQYEIWEPESNYGVSEEAIIEFFTTWLEEQRANGTEYLDTLVDDSLESVDEDSEFDCYQFLSIEFNK